MKNQTVSSIALSLGVVGLLILGSCEKPKKTSVLESNNQESEAILVNINKQVSEASKQTHESVLQNQQSRTADDYPGFASNPFNSAGLEHNNYLDFMRSQPDFNSNHDIEQNTRLFNRLRELRGIAPQTQEVLIASMQNIVSQLYTRNGSNIQYKTSFFDGLAIPALEKDIAKLYFSTMNGHLANVFERVALSKVIEQEVNAITNTSLLPDESKQRLLASFAVYRYSTYYWNVENPTPPNTNYIYPIGDAVDCAIYDWLKGDPTFDLGPTGNSVKSGEASFFADLIYSLFL